MAGGRSDQAADRDVAIVGGGPAGSSAGVFAARYGLDTVVFDRGNASLRRCAHLENFLGFPAGIDVETFYALMHAHAEAAGCDVVEELVERVDRPDGSAFELETQSGRRVTASRVVAATRYGGEYLRPLDGDAMFLTTEGEDGAVDERFDPDYADAGGRTPVDGLYVAAPAGERNAQAILSAAHGVRVARTVIADRRREQGYPDPLAGHWDWLRRDAERDPGWRDRWREWFDDRVPDDSDGDARRLEALREADVERRAEVYLADEEIERRRNRAHDRLLEHLDDERLLDHLDDERLLDHLDDERLLDHLDDDRIRAYLQSGDVDADQSMDRERD